MMQSIRKLFGRKDSPARSAIAIVRQGQPIRSSQKFESYAKEGYAKQVVAQRSINYVADAIAGMTFCLYKKARKRSQDTEVESHPLLELLDRPNPLQSSDEFFRAVVCYLLIDGNSYIEKVGPSPGAAPKELWPQRPDRFRIIPGTNGLPAAYVFKIGEREVQYPVDVLGRSNIGHLKTFNPTDDWLGLSFLSAASLGIDLLNAGANWNLALLQNSACPSGAFTVEADANMPASLTPDQREQLRKDIEERFSGSQNARKPLLLEGGIKWTPMAFNPVDMDFLNSKKVSEKDVALAFGVPGQLVGVEGSQTFANYEQARLAFYLETAIPLANMVVGYLNRWLVPAFGEGLYLAIDDDEIQALEPLRKEKWEKIEKSTILTVNEKREALGYGPYVPSETPGEQILVSTALIPLESVAMPADEPVTDTTDLANSDAQDTEDPTEDSTPGDNEEDATPAKSAREAKVFNVRGDRARRLHWVRETQKMRTFERGLTLALRGAFQKEAKELSENLGKVDRSLFEFTVNKVIEGNQKTFEIALRAHLQEVLKAFGSPVLDIAKSDGFEFELKDARDRYDQFMARFLESSVVAKVKAIAHNSRNRVLKKLREVVSGAGNLTEVEFGAQIKNAVLSVYASMEKARAVTISRTEVHNAATLASREAAKQLRIPNLKKEWIASPDSRTRDGHHQVDGTKIPLDAKFEVPYSSGVDLMDGPGDTSATPENVINCRCTLTYSTDQGESDAE